MLEVYVIMKNIPVLYERKEECCGCTACYAVCSQCAIFMSEDDEGFEYPIIIEEKCIRCYVCLNVCPIKAINAVSPKQSCVEKP